jgi:hypothetical protein
MPRWKTDNIVFSSIGLVQNLAVVSDLTSNADVMKETTKFLNLESPADIDRLREDFHKLLSKFELEVSIIYHELFPKVKYAKLKIM